VSLSEMPLVKLLAEELEIAELKVKVEFILAIMLLLCFASYFGSVGTVYLLQQKFATGIDRTAQNNAWFISIFIAVLGGSLPYFFIRFRVQSKRHRIANRMIMLVQNLIGFYRPNSTIAEMIVKSSSTMPDEVRSEWKRLELALHMQPFEEALYDFARRIDNPWAEDLADVLLIGAHYGTDIAPELQKLVQDMQTSKRNEEKRMAMVTVYRIGTLILIAFAIIIVGFNIYADGSNYRHYFLEPFGNFLIISSVFIMFASMLLVLHSGKKQF
jgi:Flp pilus assembly protein TadB